MSFTKKMKIRYYSAFALLIIGIALWIYFSYSKNDMASLFRYCIYYYSSCQNYAIYSASQKTRSNAEKRNCRRRRTKYTYLDKSTQFNTFLICGNNNNLKCSSLCDKSLSNGKNFVL